MQKERELKRKQAQAKKEAEAQARLVVLKVLIVYNSFLKYDNSFYKIKIQGYIFEDIDLLINVPKQPNRTPFYNIIFGFISMRRKKYQIKLIFFI
mgnify:CR=1 FL=1